MRQIADKFQSSTLSSCTVQIIFVLSLMVFFGLCAVWLGQDANWDLKNYHWYNAYAFLNHRLGWDIAPAMLMTYYNPLFDLVNYFLIKSSPTPRIAEFFLGTFHGVAVYFLFKIASFIISAEQERLKYFYIFLAVLLGVTGAASFPQIGTTHNESQINVFIMAAVFLALKFINSAELKRSYFCLLAAFILGLGVGLKLTAISYAIAFFSALLFYKKPDAVLIKWIFMAEVVFCLGFFATAGFWLWTLYIHFHNPLFPYYNNIFHSPYIADANFTDRRFIPIDFWRGLFYPFYWLRKNTFVEEMPMADARGATVIVLGILFAGCALYKKFSANNENASVRFLLIFLSVSYIVWLFQFSIYRYTIPINFLAGIFIVYFCLRLFKSPVFQLMGVLIVSLLVLMTTKQPNWGRVPYGKSFFEVQAPAIAKNSTVLLVGDHPVAYLISHFPVGVRFVGFYNNIVNPSNPMLEKEVVNIVQKHRGPLYVMFDITFKEQAVNILKKQGLIIDNKHCRFIVSNLEKQPLPICPLLGAQP
jgi:hypothetical protein